MECDAGGVNVMAPGRPMERRRPAAVGLAKPSAHPACRMVQLHANVLA
jgi:hypothetical protein